MTSKYSAGKYNNLTAAEAAMKRKGIKYSVGKGCIWVSKTRLSEAKSVLTTQRNLSKVSETSSERKTAGKSIYKRGDKKSGRVKVSAHTRGRPKKR